MRGLNGAPESAVRLAMPPGIFFPPANNFGGRHPGDSFQRQFDLLPHVDIVTVWSFGIARRNGLISLVRLSIFHDITSVNDIGLRKLWLSPFV
jgi:hypothetical protein